MSLAKGETTRISSPLGGRVHPPQTEDIPIRELGCDDLTYVSRGLSLSVNWYSLDPPKVRLRDETAMLTALIPSDFR